jgi:hypothetical protein
MDHIDDNPHLRWRLESPKLLTANQRTFVVRAVFGRSGDASQGQNVSVVQIVVEIMTDMTP